MFPPCLIQILKRRNSFFSIQVETSAIHGYITLREDGGVKSTNATSKAPVRVKGTKGEVNNALLSMEYVSAQDWHGLDRIDVIVTDYGHDGMEPYDEPQAYSIHILVAAVNDAPVLNVVGLNKVQVVDEEELPFGDEARDAFLVSVLEDASAVVTGISIWDADFKASGVNFSQQDGTDAATNTDSRVQASETLTVHPRVEISLSCTHGMLALGGVYGGSFAEEKNLEDGVDTLSLVGTLANVNAVLSEGIVYTPVENWSGIDVIKVRLSSSGDHAMTKSKHDVDSNSDKTFRGDRPCHI